MLLIVGKLVVILFLLVSLVLSMTGFAGSVLAFLTALIYGWATGFQTMTGHILLVLFILMAIAELIEVLSGTIGAKTFKASRQAVWGSMIGLFIGFLFAFATIQFYLIPVGLVVGVIIGEQVAGRTEPKIIFRSIIGVLIGKISGIILKSILTFTMMVIIFVHLFH
ncbi:MAG: hypothetical protein CO090_07290 [Acidobacteria bacterium CG_4_9_14_3_um_filter_49_7]|nr:MAG: hypothetical protein CO090_07290 [Acidobacteria bacterium CG_4_9_14_3_um_filter_49_7]